MLTYFVDRVVAAGARCVMVQKNANESYSAPCAGLLKREAATALCPFTTARVDGALVEELRHGVAADMADRRVKWLRMEDSQAEDSDRALVREVNLYVANPTKDVLVSALGCCAC